MATESKSYGLTTLIVLVTLVPFWGFVLWWFGFFRWIAACYDIAYNFSYSEYFNAPLSEMSEREMGVIILIVLGLYLWTKAADALNRVPTMSQIFYSDRDDPRRFDGYN